MIGSTAEMVQTEKRTNIHNLWEPFSNRSIQTAGHGECGSLKFRFEVKQLQIRRHLKILSSLATDTHTDSIRRPPRPFRYHIIRSGKEFGIIERTVFFDGKILTSGINFITHLPDADMAISSIRNNAFSGSGIYNLPIEMAIGSIEVIYPHAGYHQQC